MKDNLEIYFKKARKTLESQPIVANDVIRSVIKKANGGAFQPRVRIYNKMKGIHKMSIISSVAAIITSALFLINYSGWLPTNNANSVNGNIGIIKTIQNSLLTTNNSMEIEENQKIKHTNNEKSGSTKNTNSRDTSNLIKIVKASAYSTGMPILVLNNDELKKLNINKIGSGYKFIMESVYDLKETGIDIDVLKDENYPEKGISRYNILLDGFSFSKDIIAYKNWDMHKSMGTSPVYVKCGWKNNGSYGFYTFGGFSPLIQPEAESELYKELDDCSNELLNSAEKIPFSANEVLTCRKDKYPLVSKLVPLILRTGNEKNGGNVVLWYVPTMEFLSSLPQKTSNSILKMTSPIQFITAEGIDTRKMEAQRLKPSEKFAENKIAGIEKIELTEKELENIGISFSNGMYHTLWEIRYNLQAIPVSGINFLNKLGYDTLQKNGIIRAEVLIDTLTTQTKELEYTGWDMIHGSKTFPVCITMLTRKYYWQKEKSNFGLTVSTLEQINDDSPLLDSISQKNRIMGYDNNRFRPRINTLLPVHLKLGDRSNPDTNKIKYADIDVWFFANKEFVELLPDRYKLPLLKELDLVSEVESGAIPLEQACKGLSNQQSFFDLCKFKSGAIESFILYPNPAKDFVYCKINLSETRNLRISIHDINGRQLKDLKPEFSQNPGEKEYKLNLSGLNDGIYLIAVSSEKGEQATQRLIIK